MNDSLLSNRRIQILIGVTIVCIIAVFMHDPIAQWDSYHHFSDTHTMMGIPNALNVLSNIPFLIAGLVGLWLLRTNGNPETQIANICFCVGLVLTCFGSGYYHLAPDNGRLVWDRLPMTLAFMSFLAAVVSEHIDVKLGQRLLIPLLAVGIESVWYWHWTELHGAGDLRPYALVQFYPSLCIPLIVWMFPRKDAGMKYLVFAVIAYVAAKFLEAGDAQVYSMLGFVSGHTLKHIVAALAGWFVVKKAVSLNKVSKFQGFIVSR